MPLLFYLAGYTRTIIEELELRHYAKPLPMASATLREKNYTT